MATRREEIIQISIQLFNEKGCLNVSTRHIADELGISVGNLYYYFKNKEDIIIAIYEEFMSLMSSYFSFVSEDKDEPFDFYSFLKQQMVYEIKYRFISLEMLTLHQNFPKVKKAIEKNLLLKKEEMMRVFIHQIKHGYMISLDDDELNFLRSNTWLIGSYSEIYWVFDGCSDKQISAKLGILNLLYLLKPYLTKKAKEKSNLLQTIEYMKQELKDV